jgi:hypothetical protein
MEVDIIAGPTRDSTRRLISITNCGTKAQNAGKEEYANGRAQSSEFCR